MYKKLLAAGLGICLAAASLTGCGSSATGNKAVATVFIGASRPEQIAENVACIEKLDFTEAEIAAIEEALK